MFVEQPIPTCKGLAAQCKRACVLSGLYEASFYERVLLAFLAAGVYCAAKRVMF